MLFDLRALRQWNAAKLRALSRYALRRAGEDRHHCEVLGVESGRRSRDQEDQQAADGDQRNTQRGGPEGVGPGRPRA